MHRKTKSSKKMNRTLTTVIRMNIVDPLLFLSTAVILLGFDSVCTCVVYHFLTNFINLKAEFQFTL